MAILLSKSSCESRSLDEVSSPQKEHLKIKSYKEVTKQQESMFFLLFLLNDRRIRSRIRIHISDKQIRMRIYNTDFQLVGTCITYVRSGTCSIQANFLHFQVGKVPILLAFFRIIFLRRAMQSWPAWTWSVTRWPDRWRPSRIRSEQPRAGSSSSSHPSHYRWVHSFLAIRIFAHFSLLSSKDVDLDSMVFLYIQK